MTDRGPFELEVSPGAQPPSGLGDRILVGLALVALASGVLIAVGNIFPDRTDVSTASAPEPSVAARTIRPTPTARPPRVAIVEQLEVTVHFDDPAALTCHYEPQVDELQYWGGQQSIIDQCREKFVVTEVVVVPPS